jgi:hypothetical protein
MLALVGTAMLRSASGNLLLSDSDGVLGTHRWRLRETGSIPAYTRTRSEPLGRASISPRERFARTAMEPR